MTHNLPDKATMGQVLEIIKHAKAKDTITVTSEAARQIVERGLRRMDKSGITVKVTQ